MKQKICKVTETTRELLIQMKTELARKIETVQGIKLDIKN